jgi:hypothetical protein
VILSYPLDHDRTTGEEPRGCSPEGDRRRGLGDSGDHSEVVPKVFDGDGVHDGLQEVAASSIT